MTHDFPSPIPRPARAPSRPPATGAGRPAARRRTTPADRVYAAVVVAAVVACGLTGYEVLTTGAPTAPPAAAPRAAGQATVEPPPATGLDPELLRRFERARALAAEDGVELTLVSGWRSAQEQAQVVEDVVRKHGSREEAQRWVLPPESSAHVAGTAIDVGATEGALWLGQHGEELGLCRTYANEMWHFEPVVEPGGTCPAMHEDSRVGWE